ncbi:hypothetical protein LG58_588 [Kosakonia radicincitans YD4]|nr:hypothetical protein LG58_588 [Kosakonia radicincitans YD4]
MQHTAAEGQASLRNLVQSWQHDRLASTAENFVQR